MAEKRYKVTGEIIFYVNGQRMASSRYQDKKGGLVSRESIISNWLSFYTIGEEDVVTYGIIPDEIRDWQPKYVPA